MQDVGGVKMFKISENSVVRKEHEVTYYSTLKLRK